MHGLFGAQKVQPRDQLALVREKNSIRNAAPTETSSNLESLLQALGNAGNRRMALRGGVFC